MNASDVNIAKAPLFSPLAIAPMIDWTYLHFRVFMRFLAPHALLYTEMQTTGAVEHNPERALEFALCEPPLALQLGGSNADALLRAAIKAQERGFSEVNLNLGCPSDRVQAGRFGACLMQEPMLVASMIEKMKRELTIPLSAKTRIGINEHDSYDYFSNFAHYLVNAGCDKLVVHARKAWLHGLNPKQNRTIPPLHYDYVYRIKKTYPHIPVVINGNIETEAQVNLHLTQVDGVMLGRIACQNPYRIAELHHALYPQCPLLARSTIATRYLEYWAQSETPKKTLSALIKPMLNLAHALPFSKVWRNELVKIQQSGRFENLIEVTSLLKQCENSESKKL